MTRSEFLQRVSDEGLNMSAFSFEDPVNDGLIIRKNHLRWELVERERGIEYECVGFPSESDALLSLYEKLVALHKVEQMVFAVKSKTADGTN